MSSSADESQRALERLRTAPTRQAAVRRFFDLLAPHRARIERAIRCWEQIYRFQTPERPVVEFDVQGFEYKPSAWKSVAHDDGLDWDLQRLAYSVQSVPGGMVPSLGLGWGTSDLLPRAFGADFTIAAQSAVIPTSCLIGDLARDLPRLPQPRVESDPNGRMLLERAKFLVEVTEGQLQIAYPQMQGPLSNIPRLMSQEAFLMACVDTPELVRELATRVWRVAVELQKALQTIAGADNPVRPRQRFYQPRWIRGLIVEDYVSVLAPENFLDLARDAYEMTAREVGPVFMHTCGPTLQCAAMLPELPGVAGIETVFVNRFSKTTADLEAMKEAVRGKVVLHSVVLPDGRAVHDEGNLTAAWLRGMSRGGGFALQCSGPAEACRERQRRLAIED